MEPNLHYFEYERKRIGVDLVYRVTMMKWVEVDFESTGDLEVRTRVVMEFCEWDLGHNAPYERAWGED